MLTSPRELFDDLSFTELLSQNRPYSSGILANIRAKFINEFNELAQGNLLDALTVAEKYIDHLPLERHCLLEIHRWLLHEVGHSTLADRVMDKYVDMTLLISNQGKALFGIPPIFENLHHLERIGEMVDQTSNAILASRLGLLDGKPILLVPDRGRKKLANTAFFPYLADAFDVVTDDAEVDHLANMIPFIPYDGRILKLNEHKYGFTYTLLIVLNRLIKSAGLTPNALELKHETVDKAKEFLKAYEFNDRNPFVVLHLREQGISETDSNQYRNVSPDDYLFAIQWLLNQGITVVRIGHPKMTRLPEMTNFIDLSAVPKPGEVDIFLCAKALFFYGSPSGPMSFAWYFGTPVLHSNVPNYTLAPQNTLNQLQPMYLLHSSKILTLRQLSGTHFNKIIHPDAYKNQGVFLKKCTPDDHLDSVKEMLSFIEKSEICDMNHRANDKKAAAGIGQDIYFTSSSLEFL